MAAEENAPPTEAALHDEINRLNGELYLAQTECLDKDALIRALRQRVESLAITVSESAGAFRALQAGAEINSDWYLSRAVKALVTGGRRGRG